MSTYTEEIQQDGSIARRYSDWSPEEKRAYHKAVHEELLELGFAWRECLPGERAWGVPVLRHYWRGVRVVEPEGSTPHNNSKQTHPSQRQRSRTAGEIALRAWRAGARWRARWLIACVGLACVL